MITYFSCRHSIRSIIPLKNKIYYYYYYYTLVLRHIIYDTGMCLCVEGGVGVNNSS